MKIAFLDIIGWDYTIDSPRCKPLGGSQSSLCYLAEELGKRGHEVVLLNQTKTQGWSRGVNCINYAYAPDALYSQFDVIIVLNSGDSYISRTIRNLAGNRTAMVLWSQHNHDQPAVQKLADQTTHDVWDGFVLVSEWQAQGYRDVFGIKPERIKIIGNAISPVFENLYPETESIALLKPWPPVLCYTSTPFRGLDVLIDAFPRIRAGIPGTTLKVYSSMKVYEVADGQDPYTSLYERCRATEGVEYIGSLSQSVLAQELKNATCLAYPNTFAEGYCISVLEAMAAGCIVITSDLGALRTTTAGFGHLLAPHPDKKRHAELFADFAVNVLSNSRSAPAEHARRLQQQVSLVNQTGTWTMRALEWEEWLSSQVARKQAATVAAPLDIALQHHQAGRLQQAEAMYRQILQVQPNHPDALHLLGVIAHQVGKHEMAVECITRAIGLNAGVAEYHNNVGEAFRALGQLNEAAAHYQRALELKPLYADAYSNLGIVLAWQGRLEEAALHCRQALALNPSFAQAHYNLGVALQSHGKLAEAVESYQRALVLKPVYVDAQVNLAMALHGQGRREDALKVLFDALTAQPENAQLRGALASLLQGYALHKAGDSVRAILLNLCHDDNISMQNITTAVGGLVQNSPAFPPLVKAMQAGEDPFVSAAAEVDALMRDTLLLAALPRMVVCDPALEQVLTHVRRWIVLRSKPGAGRAPARPAVPHPFLCALAMQCFNAQYAWFVATDEMRRINALRTALKAALQKPVTAPHDLEPSLALVALYEPLHNLPGWERLLEPDLAQWSGPFQPIVREQLVNDKREQDIAARLTTLTEIKDFVSRKVQRQYEESPYPRWVTIQRLQARTVESLARSLRPGEELREIPRPASILVAGCGTGQHPIQTAMAFSDCEVLAVDLSRASLAYAARMAERYSLANITFQQADILELGKLDRRFAVIECGGVLHHLKDPIKGWRVLVGLLEPDGLMKVGLYSTKARRNIQVARDFVREQRFPSTPDGIRKCRRAVINLPDNHPERAVLLSGDFFSISGCRDLIMHVQERTFTTPELAGCLKQLGLRFLGFQCDVQLQGRFRAMFPEKSALTDLALWDRFEEANPDTFVSMYQFWCCRKQER